jgi:hypothetical protein
MVLSTRGIIGGTFMRKSAVAAISSLALLLPSCTMITQDLRHPGGYPAYELDKRTFDASHSKQIALLRAAIVVAMAARMSNATVQNVEEADSVARYLGVAAQEINYSAADIYPIGGIYPCSVGPNAVARSAKPVEAQLADALHNTALAASTAQAAARDALQARADVQKFTQDITVAFPGAVPVIAPMPAAAADPDQCNGYYVNFESGLPLLDGRIIRLLYATLPQDRIKGFAADVEKGNVLGGAWNAVKIIFVGVKGLHYAAGTYRSGQEALVANFGNGGDGVCRVTPKGNEAELTVWDAVDCLGLSHDSLLGEQPGPVARDKMPTQINPRTFNAIMAIARTSCVRLPLGSGTSSDEELMKQQSLRREACGKIYFNPTKRPTRI